MIIIKERSIIRLKYNPRFVTIKLQHAICRTKKINFRRVQCYLPLHPIANIIDWCLLLVKGYHYQQNMQCDYVTTSWRNCWVWTWKGYDAAAQMGMLVGLALIKALPTPFSKRKIKDTKFGEKLADQDLEWQPGCPSAWHRTQNCVTSEPTRHLNRRLAVCLWYTILA